MTKPKPDLRAKRHDALTDAAQAILDAEIARRGDGIEVAFLPFAPKVHGRSAQGKRAERAPPWVIIGCFDGTLKACGRSTRP